MNVTDLPAINAALNGLSTLFLLTGYVFIRKGNARIHQRFMIAAFVTSSVFLASYLYYHANVEVLTRFENPAWFRPIYLAVLISHTLLAVVVLPMVLGTFYLALKGRFDRHRTLARWTWPIWFYVSLTGVVIYLLLYQVFPQKSSGVTGDMSQRRNSIHFTL